MIPRGYLVEEAQNFLERSKTSRHIKSPEGYANHCYDVAERERKWSGEVFDNYERTLSELLDPANVLDSYNLKRMFEESGYASGLLHDIGDAYVCEENQLLATHVGRLLLEAYGFPNDVTQSVGSSWVAKEELQVAQDSIRNGSAPQEQERIKDWIMTLNPNDYVQNSVQQLIGTAADIGDDFDSRIESYIERRTDWGHDTLVAALILGKGRLRDIYELANKIVEGELDPEQVREIGVIPLY